MGLEENHPCLAIFDVFRGQQTPAVHERLESNNINHINVPANCTDNLQPLNLSVNKPLKDEMKQRFQAWYEQEVQKQIASGTAIPDVKIDTHIIIATLMADLHPYHVLQLLLLGQHSLRHCPSVQWLATHPNLLASLKM